MDLFDIIKEYSVEDTRIYEKELQTSMKSIIEEHNDSRKWFQLKIEFNNYAKDYHQVFVGSPDTKLLNLLKNNNDWNKIISTHENNSNKTIRNTLKSYNHNQILNQVKPFIAKINDDSYILKSATMSPDSNYATINLGYSNFDIQVDLDDEYKVKVSFNADSKVYDTLVKKINQSDIEFEADYYPRFTRATGSGKFFIEQGQEPMTANQVKSLGSEIYPQTIKRRIAANIMCNISKSLDSKTYNSIADQVLATNHELLKIAESTVEKNIKPEDIEFIAHIYKRQNIFINYENDRKKMDISFTLGDLPEKSVSYQKELFNYVMNTFKAE